MSKQYVKANNNPTKLYDQPTKIQRNNVAKQPTNYYNQQISEITKWLKIQQTEQQNDEAVRTSQKQLTREKTIVKIKSYMK